MPNAVVCRRCDKRHPIGQQPIFDIGAEFELIIGRNRDNPSICVECAGRAGERRACNDLTRAGRLKPCACKGALGKRRQADGEQ